MWLLWPGPITSTLPTCSFLCVMCWDTHDMTQLCPLQVSPPDSHQHHRGCGWSSAAKSPPTASLGFVGLEGNPLLTLLAGSLPQMNVAPPETRSLEQVPQITCSPNPAPVGALPIMGIFGCAHVLSVFPVAVFQSRCFHPEVRARAGSGPHSSVGRSDSLCSRTWGWGQPEGTRRKKRKGRV